MLISLIAVLVVALLLIVFVGSVLVNEATAVNFQLLGGYLCTVMQFIGHSFDDQGFVAERQGPQICWDPEMGRLARFWRRFCIFRIRGLVFYIRWLVKPTLYLARNDDDGFGEGIYVFLNETQEEFTVLGAETKAPESVAIDVPFLRRQQVENPRLWAFVAPKDVKKQIDKRMESVSRSWVRSGDEDHVQDGKGNGETIWTELMDPNGIDCGREIQDIRNRWGFGTIPNSIVVKDVDYDEDFQKALKASRQAKLLADAEAIRLHGPTDAMMTTWVEAEAERMGLTVQKAVACLKKSGDYQRKEKALEKLRAQGLAGPSFTYDESKVDITSGDEAMKGDFSALAALIGSGATLAKILKPKPGNQGNPGGGQQGNQSGNQGGQQKYKKMTKEEAHEAFREEYKKEFGEYPD